MKTIAGIDIEAIEKALVEDVMAESHKDLCRKDNLALFKKEIKSAFKLIDKGFYPIRHGV